MKGKSTKSALLMSFTSLLLCFAMLIGCTFAWFTDTVTSGVNKIQAGNLDIEVEYQNRANGGWNKLEGSTTVFSQDLWEPGHTEFVTLKVENLGTLALKYQMMVTPVTERGGINKAGNSFKLSDYLVFGTTTPSETAPSYDRESARDAVGTTMRLNKDALTKDSKMEGKTGTDTPTQYITLVVYMPESVGNDANYKTGTTAPEIELGIKFIATQLGSDNEGTGAISYAEDDSFGKDYDKDVVYPAIDTVVTYNYFPQTNQVAQLVKAGTDEQTIAKKDVNSEDSHVVDTNNEITIKSDAKVGTTTNSFAELVFDNDAITFANDSEKATVTFTAEKKSEGNFTYSDGSDGESVTFKITASVDGGNFKDNTLRTVRFFIGAGKQSVSLTHKGDPDVTMEPAGATPAADTFTYDSATGYVTMYVSHFSDFVAKYNAPVAAVGTTAYYSVESAVEAAKATTGGTAETVALIRDVKDATISAAVPVNLNGKKVESLTVAANNVVIDDASAGKEGKIESLSIGGTGTETPVESILVGDGIKVTNAAALEEKIGYVGGNDDDYEAEINGKVKYKTLATAIKAAKSDDTVTLLKDIVAKLPNAGGYANESAIKIEKSITLDGDGKTVMASTEKWDLYNNAITGMIFSIGSQNANYTEQAEVTVKNLTVIGHKDMKHAFTIVKSATADTTATFEDVTVKNCGANAFSVNGTTVTLKNVETSDCGWGAVNVDKGGNLTVTSGKYDLVKQDDAASTVTINTNSGADLYQNTTDVHIYTADGLRAYAALANAGAINGSTAILEANVDLGNVEWTQINGAGKNLTFDGNDKTISNLKVSDGHDAGFFKTGSGCTIKNLTVDGATVKGIGRIAVICGHGMCVTVDNCTVKKATITAVVTNNDDGDKVGAIVGYLSGEPNASVTNCKVENVTAKGYRDVGALVGYAGGTYTIKDNTLANIAVICDKSNDYKNYTTDAEYDVNFIVGERNGSGSVYQNNGIIAGTYDVDPTADLKHGYEVSKVDNKFVVALGVDPLENLFVALSNGSVDVPEKVALNKPATLNSLIDKDGKPCFESKLEGITTTIVLNDVLTIGTYDWNFGAMRVVNGSNVTFQGNEKGKFFNNETDALSLIYVEGPFTVNIESGTYETATAIFTTGFSTDPKGSINISGGKFKFIGADKNNPVNFEKTYDYKDESNATNKGFFVVAGTPISATCPNMSVNITGGTFYNCDPTGYVADGYTVTSSTVGNDMIYTVVPNP